MATELVDMAQARWRLTQNDDGLPFAVPNVGPRIAQPLRGRLGVRQELATVYHERHGRAANAQALSDALTVLEGWSMRSERETFPLRVAQHHDAHLLDLGWPDGESVLITAAGWHVTAAPPVMWRRTGLTGALPDPRGVVGDLGRLRALLNVTDEAWPLVRGWLVAALLQWGPVPILWFVAEQGSAKTTLTRMVASVIDASPAQIRKAPRDADQWVTAAQGSWVVALDNLSRVQDWFSDAMCRAVTGDGDVRRALYSDGDLAVFAFRRALMANTVDTGSLRGDLADRLVTVELDRIEEGAYLDERDIAAAWTAAHPVALAGLLDLAAQVLAVLPTVQLERAPRMADFARILAALDKVAGGDAVATYVAQRAQIARDVVEGDLVAAAVRAFVETDKAVTDGTWEGTAGELLDRLTARLGDDRPPRGWPRNPRTLSGRLRRAAPSLRAVGVGVEFERQAHGVRTVALTRGVKRSDSYRHHRHPDPNTGSDQPLSGDGSSEPTVTYRHLPSPDSDADRHLPSPETVLPSPGRTASDQGKHPSGDGGDGGDGTERTTSHHVSPGQLFDDEDRWADEL